MTSAETCGSCTATGGMLTTGGADSLTVDGEWAGSTGVLGLGKLTTVKLSSGSPLYEVALLGETMTGDILASLGEDGGVDGSVGNVCRVHVDEYASVDS